LISTSLSNQYEIDNAVYNVTVLQDVFHDFEKYAN